MISCYIMQSSEHLSMSVITNSQGTLTSFPPLKNSDKTIIENIKEAVFRSMNYTSKFINVCEISGKKDTNNIFLHKIQGAEYIRNHHCAGNIQYHKDYENFLDDINLYFEIQEKYFQNHSFSNLKVNFERSNGEILEGTVVKDSGLLYVPSRDTLALYITFNIGGEDFFKWIPLIDTFSKSLQKETKGLLGLNESLKEKELIIYVNETPEWLKLERTTFIETMKTKLDKTQLSYLFKSL